MKRRLRQFFYLHPKDILLSSAAILSLALFVPLFTYVIFAKDLTTKEGIMNRKDTGVTLLDRNDTPFFYFYQARSKKFVPISEIPKHTQQAIVAIEDDEFYEHDGFSIKSIIGAFVANFKKGDYAYGGSTITQQLVKNSLLTADKTFLRKYQELVLATEIDRRYTKDEILEMYANSVYFGNGAYGIEQAAETYFNKLSKDLTLKESAILAGLLPSPSEISSNPEKTKERVSMVLTEMVEHKYITTEEKEKVEAEEIVLSPKRQNFNSKAPHFAIMVIDELIEKYGEDYVVRSGYRVKTSIDLEWQEYAEKAVAEHVERIKGNRVSNGAAVVLDPKTGEVRALVGSKDWFNEELGKFNVVTADRQPGSAFKPVIYSAALEKRLITPASILHDSPTTFPGNYKPKNYDGKFRGNVLTRRALANSLNVPAVEVMNKVGVVEGLDFAKRMGMTTFTEPSNYGLSLVLGAGEVKLIELTNFYATLANKGVKNNLKTILRIEDKMNKDVEVFETKPWRVLGDDVAYLISSILSDNGARGEIFGNALNISRIAAVKTGTTENYKDSTTFGYTPSLAVGVWVGNNDGAPMDNIAGSLGAAPIWRNLMERFLSGTPVEQFEKPGNVVSIGICSFNGLRVREATSSALTENFITGTEPTRDCVVPKPEPKPEDKKEEDKKEEEKKNEEKKEGEVQGAVPVPEVSLPGDGRGDKKEDD